MNLPRPLLYVEMVEDRLLPSTVVIDGFDQTATVSTDLYHVSTWQQGNVSVGYSGRTNEGNIAATGSTNLNFNNDFLNQATGNAENTFSANGGLVDGFHDNFQQAANYLLNAGSSFSQPITIIGFGGELIIVFSNPPAVANSPDGRWSPWSDHDNQTSTPNPSGGLNGPGLLSEIAGDGGADVVAPFPVPGLLLQSSLELAALPNSSSEQSLAAASQQSGGGQSPISEQLPQFESHLVTEMTLAAISLMGSQASSPVSMLPPLVNAYPSSHADPSLPTIAVDRTASRMKAPTLVVPAIESTEAAASSQVPVEIHAPAGAPIAGAIGLNAEELDDRVSQVLDSIAKLGVELTEGLEQPETYTWLTAAGLLSFGTIYVAVKNQKSQRAVSIPFGRGSRSAWEGKEYDPRNR